MLGRGLAALVWLLLVRAAAADGPPPAPPAADRALAAHRAGDAALLRELASAEEPDPFVVAHLLFERHLAGDSDALAAAEALAKAGAHLPAGRALPGVVAAWTRLEDEPLARARRRVEAYGRAREAFGAGRHEEVVREADAAAAAPPDAGRDPTAVLLIHLRAESLKALRRLEEASAAYRASAAASAALGWLHLRRKALLGAGNADGLRGDHRGAVAARLEEVEVCEAMDRPREVARAVGGLGLAYSNVGQHEKAIGLHRRAIDMKRAGGDRVGAAGSLVNVGVALLGLGRLREALAAYEEALLDLEAAGPRAWVLVTRMGIGNVRYELGDVAAARTAYEEVLEGARAIGDKTTALAALANLGNARHALGDHEEALATLREVIGEATTLGERPRAAEAWNTIGLVHARLGRLEEAAEAFRRSHDAYEAMGDRARVAMVRGNVAMLHGLSGEPEKGVEAQEHALAEKEAAGDEPGTVATLLNLGDDYATAGRLDDARRALERARAGAERLGHRRYGASARAILAKVLRLSGDAAGAAAAVEEALPDLRAFETRDLLAAALSTLAKARLALGRPEAALEAAREVMDLRIADSKGLGEASSPLPRLHARGAADVALRAVLALEAGPGVPPEVFAHAFSIAEGARALVLAESLLHRRALLGAKASPEALEAHATARRRLDAARAALDAAARPGGDLRSAKAPREALEAAYRALDDAIGRIQRESRRAAAVVAPAPVTLATARRLVPADGALVVYQVGESEAAAWVVRADGARLVALDASLVSDAKVEEYLRSAEREREEEPALATALYAALLAPLEPALAGAKRLLVSGDDGLAFLPFEALLRAAGERRERAIERWEVVYVPSATVLQALTDDAAASGRGAGLLALGDPVYGAKAASPAAPPPPPSEASARGLADLGPLPGTRAEVESIARLYPAAERATALGAEATVAGFLERVRARKGRLHAVHVACHGHVDSARPWLSGLVLSGGEVLNLDQIYRSEIPADLVVLSACQTARGKAMRGEGVMGLVRGFFFAGAPRVVVSDWKVSDDSTRDLMVAFYGKMRKDGLPPGAALRAAKLEMRKAGGRRAHPYHWAPFVLWGLPE
jgi:CHAT domain-containing protein